MARSVLTPLYKTKYKITLWLHPAEYWTLMHASALLGGGKLSFHKWFKKQMELENVKSMTASHKHELTTLTARTWGKRKRLPKAEQQVKRNSPRKLAA